MTIDNLPDWMKEFLDGQPIRGGCDDCDATQTFEVSSPGVGLIMIYHDDGCPYLAAKGAGVEEIT